jgi:phosphoglycolate phosphatase
VSLLIFDLDGTLIDSRLDLAHAVNATRAHAGKDALSHETIYTYVGNGAPVLIRRAMGPEASERETASALEFFLDYYKNHAVDYTELYPGVKESLESLYESGIAMAVLTNKPVRISRAILDHFGVSRLLARIYGGNSFEQKKPHPVGIDTLREELSASREETWMVGDSAVDVQTARNAGVSVCGVTWGFQPESLREYPPDVLVDRIDDFTSRFLGR